MSDLIDNWTLLIVGCTALVLAGLIGVVASRRRELERALLRLTRRDGTPLH